MCGRPHEQLLVFALRAIAAGVADRRLAVWALEEAEREIATHHEVNIDWAEVLRGSADAPPVR